jgi:hypothetical protein
MATALCVGGPLDGQRLAPDDVEKLGGLTLLADGEAYLLADVGRGEGNAYAYRRVRTGRGVFYVDADITGEYEEAVARQFFPDVQSLIESGPAGPEGDES